MGCCEEEGGAEAVVGVDLGGCHYVEVGVVSRAGCARVTVEKR